MASRRMRAEAMIAFESWPIDPSRQEGVSPMLRDGAGRILAVAIIAATTAVLGRTTTDDHLSAREAIRRAGIRLGGFESERHLTAMATREADLLARLDPDERSALGSGYLRFRVDRPAIVDVAAPEGSAPFWLADRGFRETERSLTNRDGRWKVFRRSFDPGPIGLGVNGLDRTRPAHYVVFVRSAGAGQPVVSLDEGAETWRMIVAEGSVSAARDLVRPFEAIPDDLVGAWMLQPRHDARHSTTLVTGRAWKTHDISTHKPDQVAISFGDRPGKELVFTWRTSASVVRSVVRIGSIDEESGIREVAGDSVVVETASVLNDPLIRRHRVAVGGLRPGQAYRYALGDGSASGWGRWQTIRTAPDRNQPLRFLYLGDAQTGFERWGKLLDSARKQEPNLDFVVLAGDIVDRGNERTNWDHFFLRAAGLLDRLAVMPCVGNHEYLDIGPRLYRASFELPRNGPPGIDPELCYAFEAGDAIFTVMDSNLAVWDANAAKLQARWLDETLARSTARWKIAIFHHPVYPSHPWRDMPALRDYWVPVFDRHHVDLVLQGHDHSYQRTYPMRNHRTASGPDRGTIYLIAVSGDKYVDPAHREMAEVELGRTSTYQVIEIDPATNQLCYRARDASGKTIDAFEIEKPGAPVIAKDQRPAPASPLDRNVSPVSTAQDTRSRSRPLPTPSDSPRG